VWRGEARRSSIRRWVLATDLAVEKMEKRGGRGHDLRAGAGEDEATSTLVVEKS